METPKITFHYWFIWFLSSFYLFFQLVIQTYVSVIITPLMDGFHLDATEVGMVASSFLYTYTLMQLPAGLLVDRFGARQVLSISALLTVLGCVWFASASSYAGLILARLFLGFSTCPVIPSAFSLIAGWFPAARYTAMVGFTEMFALMGGAGGEGFMAHFVELYGWRATSVGLAVVSLLFFILIFTIVRDHPMGFRSGGNQGRAFIKKAVNLLLKKDIWLAGVFAGFNFAVLVGFGGLWAVPFLQTLYQTHLEAAAFASAMIFIGAGIGAPLVGYLGDSRRHRFAWLFLFTIMNLLLFVAIVYLPGIPYQVMLLLLFMCGFCSANFLVSYTIVREQVGEKDNAAAAGLANMILVAIGAPLFQPLVGFLLELSANNVYQRLFQIYNYQFAFSVLVAGLLLALVFLGCLGWRQRKGISYG